MRADNSQQLLAAARRRAQATRRRAVTALRHMDNTGTLVTFDALAREAGVSRSWLYNQPDLRTEIERLRDRPRPAAGRPVPDRQRSSDASLLRPRSLHSASANSKPTTPGSATPSPTPRRTPRHHRPRTPTRHADTTNFETHQTMLSDCVTDTIHDETLQLTALIITGAQDNQRVRGAQVHPVLCGVGVELQEHRLGPLGAVVGLERLHRLACMLGVFGVVDLGERRLRPRVRGLRQGIEHVRHLVEPAALLAGVGEHLADGGHLPGRRGSDTALVAFDVRRGRGVG